MADDDQSHREQTKSDADRTLLGVAPPRVDSSVETLQRSPVYVRSGTSVSEISPAPSSHAVSPSTPAPPTAQRSESAVALPAHTDASPGMAEIVDGWLRSAQKRPLLSMVVAPVLLGVIAIWLGHHGHVRHPSARATSSVAVQSVAPRAVEGASKASASASIAELEAKPADSLSSRELVLLSEARSEKRLAEARGLRRKVEENPALAKDSAVQRELLHLAADERTARDALAAMAALEPPVAADLLFEVWTRTPERSDATELARALVYSADVRAKASPALAAALDLRTAETCEQFKAILPNALKDGDRRALPPLTKLNAKRGCGPKKSSDCYACLRSPPDELLATLNAVKSRRAPSYAAE